MAFKLSDNEKKMQSYLVRGKKEFHAEVVAILAAEPGNEGWLYVYDLLGFHRLEPNVDIRIRGLLDGLVWPADPDPQPPVRLGLELTKVATVWLQHRQGAGARRDEATQQQVAAALSGLRQDPRVPWNLIGRRTLYLKLQRLIAVDLGAKLKAWAG